MGLLYDDNKILAARWLLNELKKHAFKSKSEISEFNTYRALPILLVDIANTQKRFDIEIIGEASELLEKNEHIIYESKDLRTLENSKLYISELGRQAIKSSFYSKLLIEIWVKRVALVSVIIVAIFTIIGVFVKSCT